jgi:FkbM family methyltransferase
MIIKQLLYNSYNLLKKLGVLQTLYYFLEKILKKNKTIKIIFDKHNYYIRPNENDLRVLFTNLEKEFEFLKITSLSFNDLIVDAGAYIGASSIRFSQLFKKNQVVAIEPFVENFNLLKKNISNYKNIIPINCALVASNYIDEVFLYKSKTGAWGNNIINYTNDNRNLAIINKVESITLKDIVNRFHKKIGILKLDIEGSEKMIFENDKKILNDINIIIVELHKKIHRDIEKLFFSFAKKRYNFYFDKEKIVSIKKLH